MSDGTLTVADRLDRIEKTQQETLDMVRELASGDRADQVRYENLETRVSHMETVWTWASRIVMTLVLTAVISGVLVTQS